MQIKPFKYIGHGEEEEFAFLERDIRRSHRDFYIYDEAYSTGYDNGIVQNKIIAGVVQVTKLLVRGIPDEEGFIYDRDKSQRMTCVKSLYIYNAFMDGNIQDVNERFRKAILRPTIAVISAYTDTMRGVFGDFSGNYEYVDNPFGISIYNFSSHSLMSILCSPMVIRDGLIAKTSRLDILDPRYNVVKYLDREIESKATELPTIYNGADLIKAGETKIKTYQSYHKVNNTFTEENMLNISRKIYGNKFRLEVENETGLSTHYNTDRLYKITDLLDKRRSLDSLIIDITKAAAYSLFESFTMTYETGGRSYFRVIKPPFKQYHIKYMEQKMIFTHTEFTKLCEKISDKYGRVNVLLHVNDVEHVARCIFLDDHSETNREITIRKTKLDCINDFIAETMYGRREATQGATVFKNEHDLDLLNYYSYNNGRENYMFQGNM